jgi:phosphoserine phosphatase
VSVRGSERLEETIRRAGVRFALATSGAGALVASSVAATGEAAGWVAPTLGGVGGLLTAALVADLVRGRRR